MSELKQKILKVITDSAVDGKCNLTNREIRKLAGKYHISSINHIIRLLCQDGVISKETNYQANRPGLVRIITIL